MMLKKFCGLLLVCVTLSGCGLRFFTYRTTNPVSEDYISQVAFRPDYGTLSTNAGRRTILVQFNPPQGRLPMVCAEPAA
jgi:hypothetical protein